MSYRNKLGYVTLDKKVCVMRDVNTLFRLFNNEPDFSVLEALEFVSDVKTFVNSVKAPQFLQIGASPMFKTGSEAFFALHRLLLVIFGEEKLYDGDFQFYEYATRPALTLDQGVERVIADELRFISMNDDLNGDRTLWGTFANEFVEWLHNVHRIEKDRKELDINLLAYRRHIVWKLVHEMPLSPAEKSFIICFRPGSVLNPTEAPTSRNPAGGWNEDVTAQEASTPLPERDFTRLYSKVEAGPVSRYFRLISNQSVEQMLAIITPGITSLPLLVGSIYKRGAVAELDFKPFGSIAYNDTMDVAGVRERLRCPNNPTADAENVDRQKKILARYSITMPATVVDDWKIFGTELSPFDIDDVHLSLRSKRDLLNPKYPYAGLRFSWMSKWRDGRYVHSDQGATVQDLLIDLAYNNATYGSGAPIEPTLPENALIDGSSNSIKERMLAFGTTSGPGTTRQTITYKFYLLRDAQLEEKDVDMTFFYARRGTTMVKPAFIENTHPPMSMLYTDASAAVSFVAAELGLTVEERKTNELAITVCYNYAEMTKIMTAPAPIQNLKNHVRNLLNA